MKEQTRIKLTNIFKTRSMSFICALMSCFFIMSMQSQAFAGFSLYQPLKFMPDNFINGKCKITCVQFTQYDNNATSISTFTYDNNKLAKIETDEGNDGTIDETSSFSYSSNGRLSKIEYYIVAENETDIRTLVYNSNGRLIREEYYEDQYDELEVTTFTYNSNGLLTQAEEDWNNDGGIDETSFYTYNANGDLTREEYQWSSSFHTFAYDANSKLIRETNYSSSTRFTVATHTYDNKGNVAEISINASWTDLSVDGKYSISWDCSGSNTSTSTVADFSGTYSGTVYDDSETQYATFEISISNTGVIAGTVTDNDGNQETLDGITDENGNISITDANDEVTITGWIDANTKEINATWIDSDGNTGTLVGNKVKSSGGGGGGGCFIKTISNLF